jgi:hypothetical protein
MALIGEKSLEFGQKLLLYELIGPNEQLINREILALKRDKLKPDFVSNQSHPEGVFVLDKAGGLSEELIKLLLVSQVLLKLCFLFFCQLFTDFAQ